VCLSWELALRVEFEKHETQSRNIGMPECDELLNETLFVALDQARQISSVWVTGYSTAGLTPRKTPAAYAGTLTAPKGCAIHAHGLRSAGLPKTAYKSDSSITTLTLS
jgi:hypothetical protein